MTKAEVVYGDTDSCFMTFNLEELDGTKIKGKKALEITKSNSKLNGVEINVVHPEIPINDSFDIVVANISAKVLVNIAPHLVQAIREDGTIIASGLLSENRNLVQNAIEMAGGKIISSLKEDGWSTIIATK